MASTRATRSWDADRFELQVGNQVLGCSQIRSHRSTRAIADRFELMASTRATRSWDAVRFDPTDQPGRSLIDSSSRWATRATRSWDAVRFELTFPTDQPGRSLIDSSSWRQPGQPGPGDAVRFELMASTRSWGCRQIRSHRSTRWATRATRAIADRFELMASTRPWGMITGATRTRGCSLIRAPGGQPGQPGPGMQSDSSSLFPQINQGDR